MPTEPQRRERQMTLWESDGRIVPLKPEVQSGGSKPGNAGAGKAAKPTRGPDRAPTVLRDGHSVLTRLDLITKRAEPDQAATFNNLYTLLNYELLWLAFRKLKRDKAPGVDGVTVDQYEAELAGKPPGPRNQIAPPELSTPTQPASRHPEREWQDAAAGHRLRGRQDRPTGGRDDPGTNLRSGLLRHIVWLPPRSLLPPGAECARSDHRDEESELDLGRRHQRLLRST